MRASDIQRFRKDMRRFERVSAIHLKDCCSGLTPAQCHVLLEIDIHRQITAAQISQLLGVEKSTLSRVIDELVKMGQVERRPLPSDRRYILLTLTPEGQALCDSINNQAERYFRKVFRSIPADEHAQVLRGFSALVDALVDCGQKVGRGGGCCQGEEGGTS